MDPVTQNEPLCSICKKTFTQQCHLTTHMRVHTGVRPYKCKSCYQTFSRNENLKSHQRLHSGEKPFQCEICNNRFVQKGNFRTHFFRQHVVIGKPEKCEVCGAYFKTIKDLKFHAKIKHSSGYCGSFECVFCDKTFNARQALDHHVLYHIEERPYICTLCPVECVRKSAFKCHIKVHDSVRQLNFDCDFCSKIFPKISDLQRHIKSHLAKNAFKCKICTKTFNRSDYLKSHQKVHSQDKPYKCDKCGKYFKSNGNLRKHRVSVHVKELLHECPRAI